MSTKQINILFLSLGLLVMSVSFFHGWYWDKSKPRGGMGWADQSYYYKVAVKLAEGQSLNKSDFHYQLGYSVLGAIFYKFFPKDPFMPVSYLLLLGSFVFLYFGARENFNWGFVFLFLLFIFYKDSEARTLNHAHEIFSVPWNNQVVFLCFSLFFYLFSLKCNAKKISSGFLLVASGMAGFTVATREETIIFILPLLIALGYKEIKWKGASACVVMFILGLLPHLIPKFYVFNNIFENVRPGDVSRGLGYMEKLNSYFSLERLGLNIIDVVYNSSHRGIEAGRKALLQANPWIWLSPLGFIFYLRRRRDWLMPFILISFGLFFFYLAGENMSLVKLKYHCLRYPSASYIIFSFLSTYGIYIFYSYFVQMLKKG